MKKYEVFHPETGHVFGYYDSLDEAEKALNYANNPTHLRLIVGEYVIIELPEVEEPELDYEFIDYQINEMIDCMERICKLANLDYISLSYFITEDNDTGASMSAWSGDSHGIAVITNRANIFKRIYKQIKEKQKIYEQIKGGSKIER